MELSWKLLCLCSGLLFFELCNGFPINTENAAADQHTQLLTGLVAVLLTVCSVVFLAGCLCCRRRNGFKEFRDSPVVASASSNLDHGHVNPITNGEFTIFTPLSPPHVNNNVFLASEQIIIRTADDYKYGDIDVSSWFDGSTSDFPRIKLKYIKELGKGWFGKVVEGAAQDITPTQSWTPVVVRILDTSASSHKRVLFLHEAEIYRCRSHDNVLGLVGRCLDTAPLLLMQEHCARGDLKGYLRRNKGNAEQLLATEYPLMWCCQLTSALKHLHDHKLVHHDVATRNCQLTVDLTLKLGDYGLGPYKYPEDYYQGAHDVPVRWASPESLNCTSTTIQPNQMTAEANVWSLGVAMWEICECGDQPYSDLSDDEVVTQVFGPNKLRLGRPSCPVMYTDYIFRLMQLCWTNFESRPAVSQIDLMLGDLLRVHKNTKHPEPVSSDDFDKRWQSFKPNAIVKTDNHVSINIEETPTLVETEKNLRGSLNNLLDVDSQQSWVGNGEISYVGRLPDAISDFDNDLSSSPRRLFKLGPTNDSLTDSMIYVQRTSSESETEDENWRKKVERGAYTEKVRLKSRSVADLMILTHVDYSESESETPLHSLDYKVNKNGRKSNLETVSFTSEGNLLNVQDDFQEELKKLQVERRDSLLFVPDSSNSRSSVEKSDSTSSSLLRELNSATEIKPANQIYNVFNVTISKFTPIHAKFSEIINMGDDAGALCFDRQNSENRSDLGYNTLHNSEIGSTDEELAYRAEDKGSTSDLEQDYDCREAVNEERVSLTEATNFLLNEIFLQAERIVNHNENKIKNENVTEIANGVLKDVFLDAEERVNANIYGSQENLDASEETVVEDTFSHGNTEEALRNNVQKYSKSRSELVKTEMQSSEDGAISRSVMPDLLCDLISNKEENHDLAIETHVEDDRKETCAQNEESTTKTEKSKLQNGANQINVIVETHTEMNKKGEVKLSEEKRIEIEYNKEEIQVVRESENKHDLDQVKHLEIEESDLDAENVKKEDETAPNTEESKLCENQDKNEYLQEQRLEFEGEDLVGEEIRKEEEETGPNTEESTVSENKDKNEFLQEKQLEIEKEDLDADNLKREEKETGPNTEESKLSENQDKYVLVQEKPLEIKEEDLVGEEINNEEEETGPNTEESTLSENQDRNEFVQETPRTVSEEDLVGEEIRKEDEETGPNIEESTLSENKYKNEFLQEKQLEIEKEDLDADNVKKEEKETGPNTEESKLSENQDKNEYRQEQRLEIEGGDLIGEEIRKEEEETAPNTEESKLSEHEDKNEEEYLDEEEIRNAETAPNTEESKLRQNEDKKKLLQEKQLKIEGEGLVEENIRNKEEKPAPNPKKSNLQNINIERHTENKKEQQFTHKKHEENNEISRLTILKNTCEENTQTIKETTIEVPKLSDIIQNNDTLMDYIITNYDNEEIDQNTSSNEDLVSKFLVENTIYDSAKEIRPKIEFDVSKEQQEAMPNSLTHSSVFNTSTPFKKPSLTEDYCSITSAKNVFDEKTQNKLDYSLETWDNFLEKTMDTQRQQENEILFDSFSSEPQSLLFLENDENNSRSSDGEAAVENQTYTLDEANGTFNVKTSEEREDSLENRTYDIQDMSESDDAQGTWQQGEGWYLHPQSSNENLSGEMEMPHTSKTDSYVGFNMDDEIMAAIRNELLQKLPHAQGSSNENVKEDEEWESGERNEVFIKYNVYNTPLSPIPEESYTEDGDTVIESGDDSTPKQQDSDSDWSDDDDEDDEDDDDDGNYQAENRRTVQQHPRQDSCCSNDTLFNLDELALCGETKTENNEVDQEEPTRTVKEEEDAVENDPPASLNSDISTDLNQSTTTIVKINDESVSNSSSSANETSLTFAAAQVAPLPSPEDNPWKQLPASLLSYDKVIGGNTLMPEYENVGAKSAPNGDIFNEADYVTLENTKNKVESFDDANEKQFIVENERKEEDIFGILTDIRFSGPIDSQLMSTSFSESNDNDDQDWDSGSDTRSSSSGEFIWKEGEHEESLKALRAAPQDVMEDVKPMEGITEEITSESDVSTSSDDEGDSPEFVPSAWDKYATPTKSALRSPEKTLETPEKKKSRGVWFKKQKYHCVYEYPREPESPVLQSQDLWTQQSDFSPFAGNIGVEDEFFVSGSNRPFDMSSQFFPGSSHWIENATPDSGTEDTTPGSSTDSAEYPTVATLPSKQSVQPLKTLAAEAINKGKTKSIDVLGGLRHTRNKLKLDLPPSPSAFTSARTFTVEPLVEPVELRAKPTFSTFGKSRFLVQHVDTPPDGSSSNKNVSFEALPYKPVSCIEYNKENTTNCDISYEPLEKDVIKDDFDDEKCKTKVEFVRGEASLLDSADEDSGIESSTLERKFCNTVE